MRARVLFPLLFALCACGGGSDEDSDGGPHDDDGGISGPISIIKFEASRTDVGPGERVELTWQTQGARLVEIETRDATLVSTFGSSGRVMSNGLRDDTTFILTASNGSEMKSAMVDVHVTWQQPSIIAFDVQPTMTILNSFVSMSWTTTNAEYLRLLKNGVEAARITANVEVGFQSAIIDEEDIDFTLEAVNPQHMVSTTVHVHADIPPTILSFNVRPRLLFHQTNTTTITWNTEGAVRTELYNTFGGLIPGWPGTTSGTITMQLIDTIQDFRLLAISSNGSPTELNRRVGPPTPEVEPNDDARFSNGLWDTGGASGELSTDSDIDVYSVFPTIGARLKVWIAGADGTGCDTDTEIVFSNGASNLAGDSDSGAAAPRGGHCGLLDPNTDPALDGLMLGQYFVIVKGSEAGRYVLITEEL